MEIMHASVNVTFFLALASSSSSSSSNNFLFFLKKLGTSDRGLGRPLGLKRGGRRDGRSSVFSLGVSSLSPLPLNEWSTCGCLVPFLPSITSCFLLPQQGAWQVGCVFKAWAPFLLAGQRVARKYKRQLYTLWMLYIVRQTCIGMIYFLCMTCSIFNFKRISAFALSETAWQPASNWTELKWSQHMSICIKIWFDSFLMCLS